MSDTIVLTSQGFDKLHKELEFLKKTKRVAVSERIRIAKDFGDLSENAEYHDAKEEQAFVESRIREIEETLKVARVADVIKQSTISIGSTVTVSKGDVEMKLEIVGSTEADPAAGKISLDSPLGQALLGKSVGEEIYLKTPVGEIKYTVKKTH